MGAARKRTLLIPAAICSPGGVAGRACGRGRHITNHLLSGRRPFHRPRLQLAQLYRPTAPQTSSSSLNWSLSRMKGLLQEAAAGHISFSRASIGSAGMLPSAQPSLNLRSGG